MKKLEIKTMAIPVMLKEAQETGVITQSTEDAIEHEKLKAQEEIKRLKRFYRKELISREELEAEIKDIEERIQELLMDTDVLT